TVTFIISTPIYKAITVPTKSVKKAYVYMPPF
ncbi:MAG: hypothetical protein K0R54_3772, partial [Clostridiaceae bacterium]|nr:hypothetical protein [Clostridiaceae bacterium]